MKNVSRDRSTNQVYINTTHDVFSSIRALDAGITNHEVWISGVHQSLICENGHPNPADICEDAYCRCKFGQWLYGAETEAVKNLEHFRFVVEKHQQMHALARQILIKGKDNQSISKDEYRDFTVLTMSFKLDVRNLQYELMSKVCVVDHLTGAWNRYAMYSTLHQEKERQMRTGHCCTICMMDIDHFKSVNDNYSHAVGDQVLKAVVDFCHGGLRKYDSIYRYGGEEFIFCLPDADMEEAKNIIERLCKSLGKHAIALPDGGQLFVTASFGIACLQDNISVDASIQAADHALLCAKSQGRDCVCLWEDDST